jgi:glycosyltransferase involved in cell wall biosynthesis
MEPERGGWFSRWFRRGGARAAPTLSVCVVAQDNAPLIPRLLENVAGIADEIVAVDGGSRDGTKELLLSHPKVRLIERACDGRLAAQKNFAIEQARGDWVLVLDTDELLGDRLRAAIPGLIATRRLTHYKLARYWIVRGPPWVHVRSEKLYPDWQLRLFRNLPRFRYETAHPIHAHFPREGRGAGRKLRGHHLFHFDFVLLDRAARERKVRRYDALDPATEGTSRMYLYEDVAHELVPCEEPLTCAALPA